MHRASPQLSADEIASIFFLPDKKKMAQTSNELIITVVSPVTPKCGPKTPENGGSKCQNNLRTVDWIGQKLFTSTNYLQ